MVEPFERGADGSFELTQAIRALANAYAAARE